MEPHLPEWLRAGRTHFPSLHVLKRDLRKLHLHTVCESARCPNIHECFRRGAATFLILGDICTRKCGFCAIPAAKDLPPLDPEEPAHVARMAASMELRHVVVTSVTRDDLPDGGSGHFAATVRAIRRELPQVRIEVLTPDFRGDLDAVARVLDAGPDIFNHNMETVARLYRRVRPQADYRQSLDVLRFAGRGRIGIPACPPVAGRAGMPILLTKSGLMLGLGEEPREVEALLGDLREAGVDIVTIGQYLQPTRRNLPVTEYVHPGQFDCYCDYGLSLGFRTVFSAPLVRSSYMAEVVGGSTGILACVESPKRGTGKNACATP